MIGPPRATRIASSPCPPGIGGRGVRSPATPALALATLLGAALATASNARAEPASSSARGPLETEIASTPSFVAKRRGRFLIVTLRRPHRVLSTSTVHGGQSLQVTHLLNFQSMDGRGNPRQFEERLALGSDRYHETICRSLGLSPPATAVMGTAANLSHLAHVQRSFQDLRVDALVTGGVAGNALRAGDPADWYQTDAGNRHVPEKGTINVMLLVNQPLTPGAQVKAASVLTEAKSAALGELAVSSRYSPHLATGTGTDQLIVASPVSSGAGGQSKPLESASQHLKLGELIGDAVRQGVLEALRWQNGLERSATRSATRALGRFGLTRDALRERLARHAAPAAELAARALEDLDRAPRLVAAAYAYAAVLDRLQYGTLAAGTAAEALRDQAASAAVAVAQLPCAWPEFWARLPSAEPDRLAPFVHALVLGYEARWSEPSGAAGGCDGAASGSPTEASKRRR